jgi:hypothetical protein
MTKHNKTIEETRDRDADLKTLADAFFRDLRVGVSKKGAKDFWKFCPQADGTSMAEFVLEEIEFSEGECPECGTVLVETNEVGFSDEAKEYAEGLWSELGVFMEGRWHELHDRSGEEEESDVCVECGCEVESLEDYDGPLVCEDCESSDESCDTCGCEDCECEDEDEEEEQCEEEEECYSCGEVLDEGGDCPSCTCSECGFNVDDCACDEEE